ncbi:DUF4089 domain-containing protein [Caulobacter sp. 602-2]|uniref:DUF4089 domain-containing protein n=1 Tax=Caulobacter sp. 602-2 TaxID=2710887 RepID=A0A6G4QWE4_9CAUL|nr:DUF4089 domain-containing protein [Caulobacter sp. 602-2]NGM49950.1 DUF4089 domain-containing protein [Caulobacter sp. 602-2]
MSGGDLSAFQNLTDAKVAAYLDSRSAELGLPVPQGCRAGVAENLALLRDQTALFANLTDPVSATEAFEP